MTLVRALLLVVCSVLAAGGAAANDDLSGHYRGQFSQTPATLKLRMSGDEVSGRLSIGDGSDIQLAGKVSEEGLAGVATSGRGTAFFEGYREFGALVIVIHETGAVTGHTMEARAEFFPAEEPNPQARAATTPERDPGLVGRWTTRQLVRQGDMVLPVGTEMTLAETGEFNERNDPDTGPKTGEWRSQGGHLELRASGADGWSRLGDYQLHGKHLITILPHTQPLVWERIPD